MLKQGDKAPLKVTVEGPDGESSLNDHLGDWVVLYFYPRDDTPGCTTEACSLQDSNPKLKKLGAKVIGVSKDTQKSHGKFKDKYKLKFDLWSDPDHKLMEAFGTWQEKSMFGKKYMGTTRSTFLIDPEGKIAQVWEKVKPDGHGDDVLKVLSDLVS